LLLEARRVLGIGNRRTPGYQPKHGVRPVHPRLQRCRRTAAAQTGREDELMWPEAGCRSDERMAETYTLRLVGFRFRLKEPKKSYPNGLGRANARRPPSLPKAGVFGGLQACVLADGNRPRVPLRRTWPVRPMRKPPKMDWRWCGDQFLLLRNVPSFAVAWKN